MSVITRRIEKRVAVMAGGTLENPANWLSRWLGGETTHAGPRVNEHNAFESIDVFTCIAKNAQTIAQLPCPVYRRRGDRRGKDRAFTHPLYDVLQEQANEEMTAFTFKETLMAHIDSWGDAYAWIELNDDGDCVGLWPLLPDRTFAFRMNGGLYYQTRIKKDVADQEGERTLPAREVLHIPGMGFDGLRGYSPIRYMSQVIGLGMAQEEYTGRLFSNGSTPPAVLTHQKKLDEDDIKRIRASWAEQHQGVSKSWRIAVLEEGMDLKSIGIPPQDAQLLEGRKYSRAQISGWYGVPPSLMGDTDRQSAWGTGIEQQMIGYMQVGIAPRAVRWEQAIGMRILNKPRDREYFAEFLIDGLVRGDIKTRYDSYAVGWGKWLTTDDIREKENLNPYVAPQKGDIGRTLLWPLNMGSAEDVIDPPKPEPAPAKADDAGSKSSDAGKSSAASRRALAFAYRSLFADTAERIIRREQVDVGRALKRGQAAGEALDTLYDVHGIFVKRTMLPLLRTYAAAIAAEVGRELGRPCAVPEARIEKYGESYAKRHSTASLRSARALLEDPAPDAVLATWSARADWIGVREVVQAGNAFAEAAYRAAGVDELRWDAGDDCSSCSALDGTTVKGDQVFVRRGAGGPDEFIPANGLGHPPLCDGCDCVVVSAAAPQTPAVATADPLSRALEVLAAARTRPSPPVVVQFDKDGAIRRANETEDEMNKEFAAAIVKLAEAVAGQNERPINVQVDMPPITVEQPTIEIAPAVINVSPQIEIPPIEVRVETAPQGDMEIVYDRNGRPTGTRRK